MSFAHHLQCALPTQLPHPPPPIYKGVERVLKNKK